VDVESLRHAARVILDGGLVAYPTESCYGLGCDPRRHQAIRRLLRLKHRSWDLGLIVIAAHLDQLYPYIDLSPSPVIERITKVWPGPYTWLVPARPGVSSWIRGKQENIAVRVTAHPGAAALCRYARRALISTSANRHNRRPARKAAEIRREFGDEVDYILEGRLGDRLSPTEIRDAITNQIIRSG